MLLDSLQSRIAANESFTLLMKQAVECAKFYEKAGLDYPDELRAILDPRQHPAHANGHKRNGQGLGAHSLPAEMLQRPDPVPPGIDPEWISVPVDKASAGGLMLAMLRAASTPVRPRDILRFLSQHLPETVQGTISNLGTRLSAEGVIERDEDGWKLLKPELAGGIIGGRLWGPLEAMGRTEVAEHRRAAILHILHNEKSGLQTVQLVERLRTYPWMKAQASKDLLKLDMQLLSKEGKVRHSGNSKKWVLTGG